MLIHASDNKGNPVPLSAAVLQVYADKQPVQIDELKPANQVPVRFVLLLDLSGSNKDKIEFEKKAAAQIFEALSKGSNQGYFGWFNDKVAISRQPLSVPVLNSFLARDIKPQGGTVLYDAIRQACAQPLSRTNNNPLFRRVLFLISDGEDDASYTTESQAEQIAEGEGVAVFALTLVGTSGANRGKRALQRLAQNTGGNVVVLNGPGQYLHKLLDPLQGQYLLTFTPPEAKKGSIQRLEVKSSDRSIEVFAPAGYSR
ncbi:MAG TPA: VWA domain-containing protein [Terriglobales bacterium]|nr:VWA domain-containing protein [Terriglobales bacterium]